MSGMNGWMDVWVYGISGRDGRMGVMNKIDITDILAWPSLIG